MCGTLSSADLRWPISVRRPPSPASAGLFFGMVVQSSTALRRMQPPLVGGRQSHPEQSSDGVGTGGMTRLRAAPFINVLSPLELQAKTEDGDVPNPWAPALFISYSHIGVRHGRSLQQDAHDENP